MMGRSTRHSSQVLVRRPSVEPTAIALRCRVFQENRLRVFRNVRERRPQIEGHIGKYARGSRAANATDCRRFGCVQIFTIIRTTLMATARPCNCQTPGRRPSPFAKNDENPKRSDNRNVGLRANAQRLNVRPWNWRGRTRRASGNPVSGRQRSESGHRPAKRR